MPEASIEERIVQIVRDQLGAEPDAVTPTARFIEDLGADSLDVVELTMAVEEDFGLNIDDDQMEKLATVGELVAYLKEENVA